MFILSINTRDDSLMIGSSEIKNQSLFLENRSYNIFKWIFFYFVVMCGSYKFTRNTVLFCCFLVQSVNCPFFFLFFAFFLRWFTISTDGGQQNCWLASSRIQDAETRACWEWLVSVYPMSLLIFLRLCKTWSLDQLTIKPCDTFRKSIHYCPMQGEKLVRNISDVKNRAPNIIQTYNPWTSWCCMGQDLSKEELILGQS